MNGHEDWRDEKLRRVIVGEYMAFGRGRERVKR